MTYSHGAHSGESRVSMAAMKLFRPRFSIRTLAIIVTLVCVYLGMWKETEREAHVSVLLYAHYRGRIPCGTHSVVPFVIKAREFDYANSNHTWNYYVDLPLLKPVKLPYEQESPMGLPSNRSKD
jgi:hypothetical protein